MEMFLGASAFAGLFVMFVVLPSKLRRRATDTEKE